MYIIFHKSIEKYVFMCYNIRHIGGKMIFGKKTNSKNIGKEFHEEVKTQPKTCVRLCYVDLKKHTREGGDVIEQYYDCTYPLILPNGMRIEEACKVISFLCENEAKEGENEAFSVENLNKVRVIMEEYGFKRDGLHKSCNTYTIFDYDKEKGIKIRKFPTFEEQIEGVHDLFVIGGERTLFDESDWVDRYFDWIEHDVSKEEISQIYQRIENSQECQDDEREI